VHAESAEYVDRRFHRNFSPKTFTSFSPSTSRRPSDPWP
jgi:hypothetical protein